MGTLANNPPLILALVAVVTVVVNLIGLLLQSRRDSSDYASRRIEDAAKISKVAQDLLPPLEKRITGLEMDNARFEKLVSAQSDQIERMQKAYDEQHAELRATKADRDNLLTQRIMWQKKIDAALEERDGLLERVKQLEAKVLELQREIERMIAERQSDHGDSDGIEMQERGYHE